MTSDTTTRPVRFGGHLIELHMSRADAAQVDRLPASDAPMPPVALVRHAGTGAYYRVARNDSGMLRAWPAYPWTPAQRAAAILSRALIEHRDGEPADSLMASIAEALRLLDEED